MKTIYWIIGAGALGVFVVGKLLSSEEGPAPVDPTSPAFPGSATTPTAPGTGSAPVDPTSPAFPGSATTPTAPGTGSAPTAGRDPVQVEYERLLLEWRQCMRDHRWTWLFACGSEPVAPGEDI